MKRPLHLAALLPTSRIIRDCRQSDGLLTPDEADEEDCGLWLLPEWRVEYEDMAAPTAGLQSIYLPAPNWRAARDAAYSAIRERTGNPYAFPAIRDVVPVSAG